MGTPLTPLPRPQIVDRAGNLTAPWQSWFAQLYTYLSASSGGGGGVVPNSRKVNTSAPLQGGGALSSDLTISLEASGITNALLAQMAPDTLKGNNTAGTANPVDLTASQVKAFLAISLTTDVTGTLQAAQMPALTGQVTTPGASLATTIAASTVANSNLAQMAADTFKGNNTGSAANPVDMTVSQAIALLQAGAWLFSSTLGATDSPLQPAATQVMTGLCAFKSSATTAANNTLTADPALQVTFNETGNYAFEIYLPFFEATSGAGGFQFNVNGGTCGFGFFIYNQVCAYTTAAQGAGPSITSTSVANSYATILTVAQGSYALFKGFCNVNATGTWGILWAQNTTLGADPTTLNRGAYLKVTKVG